VEPRLKLYHISTVNCKPKVCHFRGPFSLPISFNRKVPLELKNGFVKVSRWGKMQVSLGFLKYGMVCNVCDLPSLLNSMVGFFNLF